MRERRIILDNSPCDTNLYDGGPQTLAEARKARRCLCPNFDRCASGVLDPDTGFQCVDQFAIQVAQFVAKKEHRGGNVSNEMRQLREQLPPAPKGWFASDDRTMFTVIQGRDEVLRRIEARARNMLYGPEGTEDPRLKVGDTFEAVVAHSTRNQPGVGPIVDLARMEALEGRFGSNGGRGCDVRSGPCSCGAWH